MKVRAKDADLGLILIKGANADYVSRKASNSQKYSKFYILVENNSIVYGEIGGGDF